MSIKARVGWVPNEQALSCVLAHTGFFWGPANLLASSVTELDNTLPYLMGVTRDSAWATHGVSVEAYTWKMCTRVKWARLDSLIVVVNYCCSWCLHGPHVSCC
jgi:hypothetical protein